METTNPSRQRTVCLDKVSAQLRWSTTSSTTNAQAWTLLEGKTAAKQLD
ncbi:MAG: hypothetical protein J0653_05115 [Deltaproteobacteria bacterium]|nr:hypothetical protein [Deltaproteobacteria bacterium]